MRSQVAPEHMKCSICAKPLAILNVAAHFLSKDHFLQAMDYIEEEEAGDEQAF